MFSFIVAVHRAEYHVKKGCGKLHTPRSSATGDSCTAVRC